MFRQPFLAHDECLPFFPPRGEPVADSRGERAEKRNGPAGGGGDKGIESVNANSHVVLQEKDPSGVPLCEVCRRREVKSKNPLIS